MEDRKFLADKTYSSIVYDLRKIETLADLFSTIFPNIKVMVDFSASSCWDLFNLFTSRGFILTYSNIEYYKNLKDNLTPGYVLFDVSCDMSQPHLECVVQHGVTKVSIESVPEMVEFQNVGYKGEFILRIASTEDIHDCGCDAGDVVSILSEALSQGFKVTGFQFTCLEAKHAPTVISAIAAMYSELESKNLPLLDTYIVGEGIPFFVQRDAAAAAAVGASQEALATLTALAERYSITIDGSRFFTDSVSTIYCHINSKKHKRDNDTDRFLYYLDNGVYCSFFNPFIAKEALHPQPIVIDRELSSTETYITTLFGPTCDSIDTLGTEFYLPELKIGDWLKFEGKGYRCGNYSPCFNSFDDPDEYVIGLDNQIVHVKKRGIPKNE